MVIEAFTVPSTFATIREFILNTFPELAALLTIAVAFVVDRLTTEVLPVIVLTFTMLGAAIVYSFMKIR
jgi:hypothetical protein